MSLQSIQPVEARIVERNWQGELAEMVLLGSRLRSWPTCIVRVFEIDCDAPPVIHFFDVRGEDGVFQHHYKGGSVTYFRRFHGHDTAREEIAR